jgi:hypothetical protein
MTPSGVELFVGVKEFPESIRALKQEQEEREGKSIGQYLAEKTKKGMS